MKNENIHEMLNANDEEIVSSFGSLTIDEIKNELNIMFDNDSDNISFMAKEIKKTCDNYLYNKLVIKNIDTSQIVGLELIDKNGINWIKDFVGNAGGFGKLEESLIEYDQNNNIYLANTDTIDWWIDIIKRQKNIDEEIDNIRQNFGDEIAEQLINDGADGDLESTINGIEFVISQFYGE